MSDEKVTPEQRSRRNLLTAMCVGLGGFAAMLVSVPVIGFVLTPYLRDPKRQWRAVGKVSEFPAGHTVEVSFQNPAALPWDGPASISGAWLRHETKGEFVAFAVNCAHLGCPVRWRPEANLFMCPCHGGVYYSDGSVAAGPPPRGLTRYPVRINAGQVEILTSPVPIAT